MSAPLKYTAAVRGIIEHLEQTQMPAIEQAADMIVHALTNNGAVFCSDIGHGNHGDFINRAGGLAAVMHFTFHSNVHDPVAKCLQDRPQAEVLNREVENVRHAVRVSNLRAGDVMMLGSVSGKNITPIELALSCREKGVKTIGMTAMDYTMNVESLHPSGKRLFEAVDVVIDSGAPYGDAAVELPGYDVKVMPVSGVAHTISGWMIWGRVMDLFAELGTPASVFMSFNREGGRAYYDKAQELYNSRGY